MRKSSSGGCGHVIGVPVTSKAFGTEEAASTRDPSSFRKGNGDHLAVSLTHPSPYASFGYNHSEYRSWPCQLKACVFTVKTFDADVLCGYVFLQAARAR